MKNYILVILLCCIQVNELVAQEHQYDLVWNKIQESANLSDSHSNLSLSNGFIDFDNGNIPSFSSLIAVNPGKEQFKAVNITHKLSSLSKLELSSAKKLDHVDSKVTIKVIRTQAGKKHMASIRIPAILKNGTEYKKITQISFDLVSTGVVSTNQRSTSKKTSTIESGFKMDEGKWFKFSITETGPQSISYETLLKHNIIANSVPSNQIKLFGNSSNMLPYISSDARHPSLKEIKIYIIDGNDDDFGPGDTLLFYGEAGSLHKYDTTEQLLLSNPQYYSDSNFVFLTLNSDNPKRISTIDNNSLTAIKTLTKHDFFHHHEKEWTNFIKSGRTWVGEDFQTQNPLKFSVKSPSVGDLTLKINVCARSTSYSNNVISLIVNGDTLSKVRIPIVSSVYYNDYVKFNTDKVIFSNSSTDNIIELYYHNQESGSLAWLDYFTLNFINTLTLSSEEYKHLYNKEAIQSPGVYEYTFTSNEPNTLVWDVSDFNNVTEIKTYSSSNQYSFKANSNYSSDFIVFTPAQCSYPAFVKKLESQEVQYNDVPTMLIVSHPLFLEEAQRLADFHTNNDNLRTTVVNVKHIYNHRSSGRKEAGAIRDYIKYLYDHPTSDDTLKYVLLIGSGTYDPKNRLNNNKDYIPTYQSENSVKLTSSYVTDDFYGMLDDNEGDFKNGDMLDIGVGRLPVKTIEEAKISVDKIVQYYNQYSTTQDNGTEYNSKGSWQNKILFVADDGDGDEHMKQAEILATIVDTSLESLNISKVYVDAFTKEDTPSGTTVKNANKAIEKNISDGVIIVNYTGHGGEFGWGSERFLNVQNILNLKNKTKLPLLMTATCEFSRFDDPALKSAGEYMLLQKDGGAIALFTTVRLVFSIPNFNLNKNFYKVLIEEKDNETIRIGDLFRKTKIKNNAGTNDRNFTLLGDPGLRLAIPKKTILIDSILAWEDLKVDTLKALTQATIYGHIKDSSGIVQNDFNGTIEVKIFDKKIIKEGLNSDQAGTPFKYNSQTSLLFKTIAEVSKGVFTTDIIIPKNILSTFDYSKISLFATANNDDNAKGANKKYLLGGTDLNAPDDSKGPEIQVYINDSSFVFGDNVPPSPYFIAKLSDESGINITSNNIEDNLVLTLNKARDTEYTLNEQYQTDLNTYKSGSITYQLKDITTGSHTLEFQASDNHNNNSKFYTEFIIEEDAVLALEHVLNYPNPFTTNTGFYFEQNQVKHSSIDVLIQIYTITGKIIKTIFTTIDADRKLVGPISWNGRDDYDDPIGKGVYLYRIKVSAENGSKAEQIEKLVILK